MIDKELIKEKIDLITQGLEKLRSFSGKTFTDIAEDDMRYAALKNFFMEIIGRAIDINEHIISELSDVNVNTPKTYRDTFIMMGNIDALPDEFAEEIAKSAGFRNAIVHDYNNLDKNQVYKTVDDAITQYAEYCSYILKFLDKIK